MKIIIVNDQFEPITNGSVMTAYRFADALRARGHEVRLVGVGAPGEGDCDLPERYVPLLTEVGRLNETRFAKFDEAAIRAVFEGADIIHFIFPFHFEKKCKFLADEMGIPTTAAFHCQPENITFNCHVEKVEPFNTFIYRHFYRRYYRYFNRIHCPSQFIAAQLKRHGYPQKLYVISNGYDPAFVPLPEPKPMGEIIHIAMVGRLSPEKKQSVIIEAISRSKYADRIQLSLAGHGAEQRRYEAMGKKLLKRPISFVFYPKDQLIPFLQEQDLYVHAAEAEIEGISCIEAIACGLVPVIAHSPKSATPQFALDERSLFAVNDPADLARKIDYWIEHPEEKRAMSVKYAAYAKQFSLANSAEQAEEMFLDEIRDHRQAVDKA